MSHESTQGNELPDRFVVVEGQLSDSHIGSIVEQIFKLYNGKIHIDEFMTNLEGALGQRLLRVLSRREVLSQGYKGVKQRYNSELYELWDDIVYDYFKKPAPH